MQRRSSVMLRKMMIGAIPLAMIAALAASSKSSTAVPVPLDQVRWDNQDQQAQDQSMITFVKGGGGGHGGGGHGGGGHGGGYGGGPRCRRGGRGGGGGRR